MADAPVDMHFPDTYLRAKRAVLSFSGALILLTIAEPADGSNYAIFQNVRLPVGELVALLWLVVAYYAVQFWIEWRNARTLNSDLMHGYAGVALDARIQQTITMLRMTADSMDGVIGKIATTKEEEGYFAEDALRNSFDRLANIILRTLNEHATVRNFFSEDQRSQIAHAAADNASKSYMPQPQDIQTLVQSRTTAIEVVRKAVEQVETTRRSFDGLAKAITRQRKFLFYGWDAGSVGFMVAIATMRAAIVLWPATHITAI